MASNFAPESDSDDDLPPGWEERSTLRGQVYYANHVSRSTRWTHPRTGCRKRVAGNLPFGWMRQVLPDGNVIYANHETQKTTFTDPRLAFAIEEGGGGSSSFRQRFDAGTTADQVLHGTNLTDKVAVITGVTKGGIGFETAKSLAGHGCHVVMGCRDVAKGEDAAAAIRQSRPRLKMTVDVLHLDLTSFRSVKRFCDDVMRRLHLRPDVLILNAAVMGLEFRLTEDGHDRTLQTNYLSQVYLTNLLLDSMNRTKAEKPSVVYVTSESHRFSQLSTPDQFVSLPRFTSATHAYNDSKLFSLMFVLEASSRHRDVNWFAVHPGNMVSSNLCRSWWVYRLLYFVVRPFSKSLQQAAATVVFAAVSPEVRKSSGIYLNNCFPCNPVDIAMNSEARANLWNLTQSLMQNI